MLSWQKMTKNQDLELPKKFQVRNHHCFIPMNSKQLQMFRISSDSVGTSVDSSTEISNIEIIASQQYIPGNFFAAVYDQTWYVGNIVTEQR